MHLEIDPRLAARGLTTFADIFEHSEAEIISGHPTRNVARLVIGTERLFLKRQLRIPWKDYWHSWQAGFGLVDRSRREWQTLLALRRHGLSCPEPLAVGFDGKRSFLLVRELENAADLHTFLARHGHDQRIRECLAERLGGFLARFHGLGFIHPDLYAKHVFVRRSDGDIALIDFQRTTRYRFVPWHARWRDLAALDASLGEDVFDESLRYRLLETYLQNVRARNRLVEAMRAIRRRSCYLQRRRKIQAMRHPWRFVTEPDRLESAALPMADLAVEGAP